jgi:xanthine dehydrogenase accessory factor
VKDIYDILREGRQRPDESLALATLVRAEGSSYRRPGARMLICKDGKMVGSLSAGCLEEEVVLRAREVLRTGQPALMSFDTRKRFGCAGKIDIFIERAAESFFADLAKQLDARRACVAVTTNRGTMVRAPEWKSGEAPPHSKTQARKLSGQYPDAFDKPKNAPLLIHKIHPPIRLFILGDGLDSKPFHSLGNLLGWQMLEIIDANKLAIVPDEWTAAIVKSHNYGRDFAALQRLLPLDLRYVGLIGPRKRRNQLLSDLLDLEVTINAGFFAPAGLDLGAETPEEIALAIVSEVQRVFAAASGESLRDRKMSIHASPRSAVLA